MARRFDATLKFLIERYPQDWLRLIDVEPIGAVSVIDADVATVSAAADKVILIEDPQPWLLHLELQASYDAGLPKRMHLYNTLLSYRHDCPVHSVAVLLRRAADGPVMVGEWSQTLPRGEEYLRFHHEITRVWSLPADEFLRDGLGVAPLAVLADDAQDRLPAIIEETQRQAQESDRHEAEELLSAEYVLLGLRYPQELNRILFQGVRRMHESTTYQAILDEGRVDHARKAILQFGTEHLGQPDAQTQHVIESIDDVEHLDRILGRVWTAESWEAALSAN